MERTASSEKKRSSMNIDHNGQDSDGVAASGGAKKRASLTIETGQTDKMPTANRRSSPAVEIGRAETVSYSNPSMKTDIKGGSQSSLAVPADPSASTEKKRSSVTIDTVKYKVCCPWLLSLNSLFLLSF